jgi:hypothetical protein
MTWQTLAGRFMKKREMLMLRSLIWLESICKKTC